MVCAVPLHRLERRAAAEAQAGLRHKERGSGVGTGIPDGEAGLLSAKTRTFTNLVTFDTKGVARTVTLTESEE